MKPSCTVQVAPCPPPLGPGISSSMASIPCLPSLPNLPSSLLSLPSSLLSLPSSLPSSLSNLPPSLSSLSSLPSSLHSSLLSLRGQEGEKQLFEKFWKGTFKAVATPRPESVIVASITARTRVTCTEPSTCQAIRVEERKKETSDSRVVISDRQRCIRDKKRKHGSHRRVKSLSLGEDLSPQPGSRGKRKKRKSERRRKRKRSPSYSLSPLRKKKKKKKKSSKKSKRHKYSSKKNKHSSSSLRRKRRDDRKHKKSSRGRSHRRRRYHRSESETSSCRSSSVESRNHLNRTVGGTAQRAQPALKRITTATLDKRALVLGPSAKSVCKTAPSFRSVLSTGTTLPSKPGDETLNAKGIHLHAIPPSNKGPQDYDSGNDTSSPPSTKTGVSRINGISEKRTLCPALVSPEKQKFPEGDNASDSGNSVTSYASLCKPLRVEGGLISSILHRNGRSEQMTPRCRVEVTRPQQSVISPSRAENSSWGRTRGCSSSSRSRSRSSRSSRHSRRRHSHSRSQSPTRSYSRSPSYSPAVRRRGSIGSARSSGSYFRYSPDRVREQRRSPSLRGTSLKGGRKSNKKRHRRKSFSPMRKRRRDSPSHLEARRITSARKRPIPYFRPSPSSSSRSSSVSSWSSLFTKSRSRSLCRGLSWSRSFSRGRSRGRSDSSYRSYSRSSSWNSIFGVRSRSRSRCPSCISLDKHGKTRY